MSHEKIQGKHSQGRDEPGAGAGGLLFINSPPGIFRRQMCYVCRLRVTQNIEKNIFPFAIHSLKTYTTPQINLPSFKTQDIAAKRSGLNLNKIATG